MSNYTDIWLCDECAVLEPRQLDGVDITNNYGGGEFESDGVVEFSHGVCDYCGTTLFGTRYKFAYWGK